MWLILPAARAVMPSFTASTVMILMSTPGFLPAASIASIAPRPMSSLCAYSTSIFGLAFLKANPKIDVLYAHNDDMGLGAIEAIEAAGKKPGVDIKIITIDAVKDGMTALAAGKINHIVECSPLLGPQLMDLAKKVMAGETIPQRVLTEESEFTPEQAKAALPNRKY